jgi:pimeloyl-ACP methyl ester carboxylesterase
MESKYEPKPFTIQVDDAVLDDLRERLSKTRWSPTFNCRGKDYGQEQSLQESLLSYWLTGYDWRKHEKELNSFRNFKMNVQGLDLHFIHERSRIPGAVPIILVHGWPGSVWEFHNAIPLLVNPTGRALRLKQAFHVIVPSLPGFGWSEASKEPGMNYQKIASMLNELMIKLGYDKYVAQGGDWGAFITKYMAFTFPNNCVALHQNMPLAGPPAFPKDFRGFLALTQATVDMSPLGMLYLSEREKQGLEQLKEYNRSGNSYLMLQASKPHTLGYGLSDTPAGLLSWLAEKYQSWTDGRGNVLNALSKDDILTNVMIYWATNCISSSCRIYYESLKIGKRKQDEVTLASIGYIEVPTGFASFPKEIVNVPRRWLALNYNMCHYTEFPEGGHFAAWEQPTLFVQDLRTFAFRSMPFEKACKLAEERELRKQTKKPPTNSDLATNLLMFAPALPVPAVAAIATYLLASKL